MNKKQVVVMCLFISLTSFCTTAYPITNPTINSQSSYYTDEQLLNLAITKGIIPKNRGTDYFEQELKKKNSIAIWIVWPREGKIALVDSLKKIFLEKEGTKINNPSEYYVDIINTALYNSICENKLKNTKGIKALFVTTVLMEGDFDNGEDKVELLKNHLGEKLFEAYKKEYPEKYQYLVEMAK
ncbi:MAG: hypothetical protein WCI77_06935 [Candidatus Omnitrophota bacterium]